MVGRYAAYAELFIKGQIIADISGNLPHTSTVDISGLPHTSTLQMRSEL